MEFLQLVFKLTEDEKTNRVKQWRLNKPLLFFDGDKMSEIILKIDEIPQQHVGRGRAIVDPKIIEDQKWNTGQILELTYNKKTHVKLWPGSPEEYGTGIIKIDGITRQNIGAGIGDKISIKSVEAVNAEQIVLSPTEKIAAEGLQEYMIYNYLNHVFTTGDSFL